MSKPPARTKPAPEPSTQDQVVAKVSGAYAVAVDKASTTTREVISTVEANPLAALLGGLALGAAVGALVPRGDKEKALLAPLGDKLAAAAAAAVAAGREAGSQALGDSGLSVDGLREQVTKLLGQAGQAAGAAGNAAVSAARDSARG